MKSALAVANPMLLLPPVMTAIFPSSAGILHVSGKLVLAPKRPLQQLARTRTWDSVEGSRNRSRVLSSLYLRTLFTAVQALIVHDEGPPVPIIGETTYPLRLV